MRNLTDIQLWFERVKVAFANQMIALGAAQQDGESYDENLPIRMQAAYTFINDVEWRLTNTPQDVNTIVKQIYKTIGFVGTALPYIDEIYNSRTGQFDPVLVSIGVVPLASETVYGRVRLSYPPLSILDPIAIGDNDPRIFQGVDAFDNIITEVSVDANGNIVLSKNNAATLTSSQSLILNQFSAPQSASMWISGNARVDGNITSSSFIKTGGLSTQFLKADGSVDSNTYLTGNQTITLSGDISGSGTTSIVTTIGAGKVTNNMLAGSIASSKLIGTDIATVGTITSGIWNGTAIANAYIGTGIDATKIADGSVTNAEFQFINTLTSNAQTQLDNKQPLDADLTAIASLTADGLLRKTAGVWGMDSSIYLTGNQTITLSGEASGSGATAIAVTLSNSAVIGKLLTGYVSGAGVVSATDSILTAIQKLNGNIGALVTGVSSVFGRTGAVTAQSGDYTTAQVTESGNLYFTNARARASISETITGIDYDSNTGVFSLTAGYVIPTTTSAANWDTAYTNRITSLTTTGSSGAATLISNTLNIPNYTLSGLGGVPYIGATTNVDLGEYGIKAGYFAYDTTPTSIPTAQGSTYWDVAEETIEIIMNGAKQHIGLDTFYNVKNSTGVTIPKGTAVRFAGTDGGSGHLLIAPFLANGTYPSTYYMGITAEDIANGDFGKVMQFGKLRGINTSTFTNGDILYASTTVAGGFQTTAPVAPNNIVIVASVVHASNNGTLVVRATLGSNINSDEGVKITSPATGQLLQLQASGLWENKSVATILGGTSSQFVKGDGSLDSNVYLTGNQTITLSGEASGSGATSISVTLANSAVIGKVLTGLSITGGAITSSDTILSAFGKVQNQINGLMGGVIYKGTYNASTNTPTLSDGTGTQGWYYVVSVAGTQNFGSGNISFNIGDWAIYNGSIWEKVDNTDSVTSVNGQIGAVVLTTSDITEGTNLYYTNARGIGSTLTGYVSGAGTITAADSILSAIQKLNGNVSALVTGVSSVSGTSNRITVSPTSGAVVVDIASNYAGQNTITTVGTIGTGVWQGTAIADAYIASSATWNAKIGGSGTTNYIPKFTASGTIGDSIIQAVGAGITVSGEVSATAFNVGNGQYFVAVRNSGSLPINLLGIEAGSDDTRLLITGDFNIKTGALNTVFKVAQTGVITINTTPTTSAGTFDLITRNTSTGVLEKVASNYYATAGSISGTTGKLAKFTSSGAIGDSIVSESGGSITIGGTLQINAASGYNALFQQSGTNLRINYLNQDLSANVSAAYRAVGYTWQDNGGSAIMSLSATELITFGATDTGEAHIFGGSARVNGALTVSTGRTGLFSGDNFSLGLAQTVGQANYFYLGTNSSGDLLMSDTNGVAKLTITQAGAATFSSSVTATQAYISANNNNASDYNYLVFNNTAAGYGDWNIYKTDTNNLAIGFGTSAGASYTNALTFAYGGNVGIGTTSPEALLDVYGSLGSGRSIIRITNSDTVNYITVGAGIPGISNAGMNFTLDGTSRMVISAGGNVGIGATDPSYKLEVNGTLGVAGAATFSSSVTATSFVKTGGTSAQFLKADGSVDSNTYLPTSAISGTTGKLAKFTASGAVGDSIVSESGIVVTVAGTLNISTGAPNIQFTDTTNGIVHYVEGTDTSLILYSDFANTQAGSTIDFRVDGNTTRMSLSATELITFGATDTGEAHIFGGSARVNGSLLTTGSISTTTSNINVGNGTAVENVLVVNALTYSGVRFARGGVNKWAMFNNNAGSNFFDIYNYDTATTSLSISPTNQIITNVASNTGEHFIIGGSARVNGSLFTTDDIRGGTISSGVNINLYSSSYGNKGLFSSFGTDGGLKYQAGALGANEAFIYAHTSVDLSIYAGGTQKLWLKAGGNFGVGVNPTNAKLEVVATTGEVFRADAAGGAYRIIANQSGVLLGGNVGIGTTSPSSYSFNDPAFLVVANTSGNSTLSIVSSTTGIGYLAFADGTTGTDRYSGSIFYNHSTDTMSFKTAGTDRLEISSTGAATFSSSVTANSYINSLGRTTAFGFRLPDWQIYNTSGGALAFNNYTTDFLTIASGGSATFSQSVTAGGSVGVGGTNTDSLLTINGTAGTSHERFREGSTTVGFVGGANGIITGHNGKLALRAEAGLVLSGQGNAADFIITSTGKINMPSLPTSSAGLSAGDLWSDDSVLRIGTSGTGFIKNQFASAQTASMWVSGDIKTNSRVYVGTNGCYIEEVLVGSTYELRVVDSAGNTTVIS